MRRFNIFLFFFIYFAFNAQDKIYFLNGTVKSVKVIEISNEIITTQINGLEENFNKQNVLLIEFKNGSIELINSPKENIIYDPNLQSNTFVSSDPLSDKVNFVSFNSLALYNADVCVFYEHLTKNKLFGLGVMGAYNFNLKTTLPNLFLSNLHNAKKNYDLGATINFYPVEFAGETSIYFGLMIKYTDFSFDKVKTDSIKNGSNTSINISYSRTNGSELATIFTAGTHTFLNDQFYLRTLVGIGAFKLNGDFKREFNTAINKNSKTGSPPLSYNFLPKIYLGINIGFNF